MNISKRTITVNTTQENDSIIITVLQSDEINVKIPAKFEYSLSGEFDDDLVLKSIKVLKMEGSMGEICFSAKDSLKHLLGSKVGKDFNQRTREIMGPDCCMHFPPMLREMASNAMRTRQIKILRKEGREAFINNNKEFFANKCVGYKKT